MSSKTKSGLSETPPTSKASPATPRVSKPSRGTAKLEPNPNSPLPNSRLSIDRSPKSVNSVNPKPTVERRSPRVTTPPEKPQTRSPKLSELQEKLNLAQEDLKKAREQLVLVEKEKADAVNELKDAQKLADEVNIKLREAVVAQKKAEESSEIEKFRAVELEQAGLEAAQKKEDDWQKELDSVRNQHALDVAALLSATQELQRMKQELAMNCDAKNRAMSHADDATKIAEIHAEKVELLSAEVIRLKASLDSKLETDANESNKMVIELKSEIELLKQDLEKENELRDMLLEKEASNEQLSVELEAARMAESYARNLVDELQKKVKDLEEEVEEACRLEKAASESLDSVMKQLEGKNDALHDAEAEIASLTEKVGLLEMSIGRQKVEILESEHRNTVAKEEASALMKLVETLKHDLETLKEEKAQALNNEKLAASSVESLLEEKNKFINELESVRAEEEKSKKAMESLTSALHEVSIEGREIKEKLISAQAEHENYETQIEDLKLVMKAKNEKYEAMLGDANQEIDNLTGIIKQTKNEFLNAKAELEGQKLNLVNSVKQTEEDRSSLEKEVHRLESLLRETQEEASATKKEGDQLKDSLKEAESEVVFLKEDLGEAKAETMKLKEVLLDKEKDLQHFMQENEEVKTREVASLQKIDELTKLLYEVSAKKQSEEQCEFSDSEKDYDMLPKVVEFSEENGHGGEEIPRKELLPQEQAPKTENSQDKCNLGDGDAVLKDSTKIKEMNGKLEEEDSKQKEEDSEEVDLKMWESCKIGEKDFLPEGEQEQEPFEEELDSKLDGSESVDQTVGLETIENGGTSPSKLQQQKKKKPLLRKFGSLLKKKSTNSQK